MCSKHPIPQTWSIDSGLWSLITYDNSSHLFSSYTPCPGNLKVRIADGSLSTTAEFSKSSCEFLDLLGKKIGNAKECEGLYYLEDETQVHGQAQISSCEFIYVSSEIMLWHKRLGHPSFLYLKSCSLPFSLKNISAHFRCEKCETCQLKLFFFL